MKKLKNKTNEKKIEGMDNNIIKTNVFIEHFEKRVHNITYKEIFTDRFNELLKKFIEDGHQQKEITEKTGISPASITQYKNGTNIPKGDILEKLANYFNVSSNYLLGKSDTPTYTFEDINKKTGLSQKSIETLYKLQHDCFDEHIDITEEKEISNHNSSYLNILNKETKDKREKLDFYEYKLTKDFIYFVQKLERSN